MANQLKQIFSNVLNIPLSEIHDCLSPDTNPAWDSMNHLNLISVSEEELGVDIDPENMPKMMESYASFRQVIEDLLKR